MPSKDEVLDSTIQALETVSGTARAKITPTTKLVTDLRMQSIDFIDFLFELERRLNLSINLAQAFEKRRQEKGQREQFDLEVREIVEYIVSLKPT